jgi:inosose dehydratase
MQIGFHTDAFNSSAFSFEKALQWAQANGVTRIEPGVIDGVSWIHGLGYFPHVSLAEDPVGLREKMASYGVSFSQIDAAYPLSGKDGPYLGLPYVLKSIPWAKLAGSPMIATTDGLHAPEGLSDREALESMRRSYGVIVETAERYAITVNIEIHGYFTTKPDMLEEMLALLRQPLLRPQLRHRQHLHRRQRPGRLPARFLPRVKHVHVKDVSASLAEAARGQETGIAISHAAIGDGVNAGAIVTCLEILRDAGFDGTLSLECEGQGGPLIERSLGWVRGKLQELGIPET